MSTNVNSGDEEPPSMVKCRVCGSMIDVHNKKEQHVVKCEYCNEATVSTNNKKTARNCKLMLIMFLLDSPLNPPAD